MKKIPITKGKFALVDDEDYSKLSLFKWHVISGGYVGRRERKIEYVSREKRKIVSIHRTIMNYKGLLDIDHINGDKLDNRKCNLRICKHKYNSYNRKLNKNSTSGHKGVSFKKIDKLWVSYISFNGKLMFLGKFKKIEDAIEVRRKASLKYHKKFSR